MGRTVWGVNHDTSVGIERVIVQGSRIALLALTVGFLLLHSTGRSLSLEAQMVVYLVGMVGLNLPHGGFEHFENLRYRGLPFGTRYIVLYLSFLVGFVALFFVAPVLALGLAFATAVFKGGHGDLRIMDGLVGSGHLTNRFQRGLAAFVRGGAIMIIPLVFWPEVFYGFASYMVSIFDPAATGLLWERMEWGRTILGAMYALAVVCHLALGFASAGFSSSWLVDAGETALLVAYFATVPVVVAIGLYFPLWYSMRQSGRAWLVHRQSSTTQQLPPLAVFGALVAGALATGLVAAALWVVVPNPLGNATLLPGLVAFYTVFICIVALPHVVVGEWLDLKRGIWYVP